MKQRVLIETFPEYAPADRMRRELESEHPETEFQVRKSRKGYKVVRRESHGAG